MENNNENSRHNIQDENTPKPMDSKREVEQSPDAKTDQDFPGYPHYPAKEDIMDQRTGAHRVDADLAQMGTGPNATGVSQQFPAGQENSGRKTSDGAGEGEQGALNDEIGVPQNVSNDELGNNKAGTDIQEAAEKGSLNP